MSEAHEDLSAVTEAVAAAESPATTAIEPAQAPPQVETSSAAAAAAPEASPATPPLETLLSGGTEAPAAAVRQTESEAGEAAAPPAVYEWQPFTLPDDLAAPLEEERVAALREALTADGLSPQDRGQRLVDLHIAEMHAYDERALERQISVFQDMQRDWIEKFKGDPEIGGSAAQTSVQHANSAIRRLHSEDRRFGQPLPAQQNGQARESDHSAFMDMLRVTGAINHPEMVRHLTRVENLLREPARAAPAIGPSAVPRDIGNRRPSTQAGNPGRGARQMRELYDNPRSQEVFNGGGR